MLTSTSHPLPFNMFQILLLSSVKHHMVVKRLVQSGHTCDVIPNIKEGLQLISANHHQVSSTFCGSHTAHQNILELKIHMT